VKLSSAVRCVFDDANLVSGAGLVSTLGRAQAPGLHEPQLVRCVGVDVSPDPVVVGGPAWLLSVLATASAEHAPALLVTTDSPHRAVAAGGLTDVSGLVAEQPIPEPGEPQGRTTTKNDRSHHRG
jgi:hypothetical protein